MNEEKSYIYYRFVHDVSTFKRLEFVGPKLSVKIAREIIAKANGIEKEYKKTFNLQIYEYIPNSDNNSSATTQVELTDYILPNTKCLVKRVLWHEKDALRHVAEASLVKKPFPSEYLCQTCFNVLIQPVILRCSNKCGKSICRLCAEYQLEANNNTCPFCNNHVNSVLPNKVLADIIAQLKIEEFELNSPATRKSDFAESKPEKPNLSIDSCEKAKYLQNLAFLFPLLDKKTFELFQKLQETIKTSLLYPKEPIDNKHTL